MVLLALPCKTYAMRHTSYHTHCAGANSKLPMIMRCGKLFSQQFLVAQIRTQRTRAI